jgi:hypothetical protein
MALYFIPNKKIYFWAFLIFFATSLNIFAKEKIKRFPVVFEEHQLFHLSHSLPKKSAQHRASEASKLLSHAIESKRVQKDSPLVHSEDKKNHFLIYVRGNYVVSLFEAEAKKEGAASLKEYASLVEARLKTVVEEELERERWQRFALRFFISVIMIFLGFFLLRQLKIAFDKFEDFLVSRRARRGDIIIFGVPIIKSESFSGVLAFLMEMLRWFSYVTSVLVVFVTILSQFESSRAYLRQLGKSIINDFLDSLQAITSSLPGVLLAALILLSLHIGLHAFNLMLDGIKNRKVNVASIPIHRIPIFKTAVPLFLLAIFLPLAVAAFFQRFDTPIQWLLIGSSLIIVLGSLPILATWMCGTILLWRNELKEGEWVLINGIEGEISSKNSIFLHLVPLDGGTVTIPMLKVFLSPIKKCPKMSKKIFDLVIKKNPQLKNAITSLNAELIKEVDGAHISPNHISKNSVTFDVYMPISHHDVKEHLLYRVLELIDSHKLELVDRA